MPILRYKNKGYMSFKHERFDRHDVFEMKDTSLVLDIIQEVRKHDGDNDNLINMLFGLFDGYWYLGLESALRLIPTVPSNELNKLSMLLKRVSEVSKPSIDE